MTDDETLEIMRRHTSGMVELDETRRYAFVSDAKLTNDGADLTEVERLAAAHGAQRATLPGPKIRGRRPDRLVQQTAPPTTGFWVPRDL